MSGLTVEAVVVIFTIWNLVLTLAIYRLHDISQANWLKVVYTLERLAEDLKTAVDACDQGPDEEPDEDEK